MNVVNLNPFLTYTALGYGPARLVPIIPPDAQISEGSSLFKRVGTDQDGRGKTPGVKGPNGSWYSFDWVPHQADETDLARWGRMGAGVGIKTGDGLIAIDADTLDSTDARIIRDIIEQQLGRLPVRVGRYPKALYLCRVSDDYRYTRVDFGERKQNGSWEKRVEILSAGRQFVAHGVHPSTKQPYHWPRDIVPFDELPIFTAQQIDAVMEALRSALPKAAPKLTREGGDPNRPVNQDSLRGRLEVVRKAVQAIPNTSATFGTRESYRDFGYAIKAALPDEPEAAFELFADWCERWQDGQNDPDIVAADWNRMKPPFRRGAGWLYETAERIAPDKFTAADPWFESLPDEPESPFRTAELNASREERETAILAINPTPYSFIEPSALPRREWLYGTHYIRSFVSATVAPSGVGKSSLEIVEALAMASGKPLLGVEPRGQFRVWLWNGEDPMDELNRRVAAAMQLHGLTREDIGGRLWLDSGRDIEIILATETRDGAKISEPVERGLMQAITLNAFDVLQVDPFVSSHRVSENDNNAIDVVAKRWARIADRARVAVELVHHVRKLNGNEVTVEDGRGASALIAAARPVRAIARMTKAEGTKLGLEGLARRLFRFADGKNNLALPADDGAEWFELASQALGNGAGDGLDAILGGDHVGVVRRFVMPAESASLAGDDRGAALRLLASGEWRKDVRAGDAWAGVAIGQAMRLDVGDTADMARVKAILSGWIKDGTLREVTRKDENRNMRTFVEVVFATENEDKLSNAGGSDIFG